MRTRWFWKLGGPRSRVLAALLLTVATVALAVVPAAADTPSSTSAPAASPSTTQAPGIPGVTDLLGPSSTSSSSPTTTTQPASAAPAPPASLPPSRFSTQEPPPPTRDAPIADPLFAARLVADQIQARIDALTAAAQDADRQSLEAASAAQQADLQAQAATKARDAAAKRVHESSDQLSGDAVLAYVQGGEPVGDTGLSPTDSQLSSRTYLGSLMAQHQNQLDQAKAQLKTAEAQRVAAVTAATDAHQRANDAAGAVQLRHAQIQSLNADLLGAIQRVNSADAASRPLTLEEIAALLQSYDAHFAGDGTVPAADQRANEAVKYALAQVGKPYVWGGNGPDSYDCSGLTQQSWLHGGGVTIPRVASDQQAWTIPVPASAAQPGDLVFFGGPAFHVGMYLGDGMMVDAPHQGAQVRVEPIWRNSFSGFGRVP